MKNKLCKPTRKLEYLQPLVIWGNCRGLLATVTAHQTQKLGKSSFLYSSLFTENGRNLRIIFFICFFQLRFNPVFAFGEPLPLQVCPYSRPLATMPYLQGSSRTELPECTGTPFPFFIQRERCSRCFFSVYSNC